MKSRLSKLLIRSSLALRQNRAALFFVAAWLACGVLAFARAGRLELLDATLAATCIVKVSGRIPGAYESFTEVVVFGLVASLVLANVTRKYRPEETCRALAGRATGHVVVVGWTNLGKRVHELVASAGRPVVLVEQNAELVQQLIRDEEPVVVGDPQERMVLEAAGVARAQVVVIATDDLESAAVACRIVRELNASCELVVRSSDADVGTVLARTYRARSLSTARLAAEFIQTQAVKLRARAAVVVGKNGVGTRVAAALVDKRIAVTHVEGSSDPSTIAGWGVAEADLVVLCDDDLGDNLIRVDRIRDLNKRARIVCRAFHEDAAEILTRAPFECVVLSTSRHAADTLVRAGVFREVGIDAPEPPAKRALAPA